MCFDWILMIAQFFQISQWIFNFLSFFSAVVHLARRPFGGNNVHLAANNVHLAQQRPFGDENVYLATIGHLAKTGIPLQRCAGIASCIWRAVNTWTKINAIMSFATVFLWVFWRFCKNFNKFVWSRLSYDFLIVFPQFLVMFHQVPFSSPSDAHTFHIVSARFV